MATKLKVTNIKGDECVEKITKSIQTMVADAKVDVDVKGKTITVDGSASEETIKQIVQSAGYTIEGY
ncbi:heavy-metal-associated domain-containing protein [Nostoc sp. JL33]|uniref:heavy-metal-associated domain-containing protein n=1 Tax=Nostoc sp. JL33 TaxID=2815396 RepID=UPI0025D1BECC|nr:heavy-metal-associated domain-containing protein [Nostoc sp. JL33]MBN3871669.1 heavy-metal-associated domain-containing protein [Nostoc sp. JL33]